MKKIILFIIIAIVPIFSSCDSKNNVIIKECIPIIGHSVQHDFVRESEKLANINGVTQIIPAKYDYTYTTQNSYFYILKCNGKYGVIEIMDEGLFRVISICGVGCWEIDSNFSVYDYVSQNQKELIEKMCWYNKTIRCLRNGYYKIEGKN